MCRKSDEPSTTAYADDEISGSSDILVYIPPHKSRTYVQCGVIAFFDLRLMLLYPRYSHPSPPQETAAIIADPRSIIGSGNPLQAHAAVLSRQPGSGSEWREAWKGSAEAKGLEGAMCFKLVSGLQDDGVLSCCPLEECWPDTDTR